MSVVKAYISQDILYILVAKGLMNKRGNAYITTSKGDEIIEEFLQNLANLG